MNKKYYITTPIYYPSDNLHIGHSYCSVACDSLARFRRMQGYDVMFLTGTDEHGQKIEEKAKAAGVTPKAYVDKIVAGIHDLWKLMNITHDRFIRTTDDYHIESVQKIFKTLYDKGDIYKSTYEGKYCTPCESFWTESQLVDGKCPDCGREVKTASEEAYFFRLSKYENVLKALYKEHPEFLEPASRRNEMLKNFLEPGLDDLCVSRTSFTWGVPVDFDPGHIVYVWVDALSNYITALGYDNETYHDFDHYWPADVHVVGKEIVRFHAIIWPALLMALELPLPKKIFGHGWLTFEGGKMSKSVGNVVDPVVLCERYGVDALRYFLMREFPFGSDGLFSNEALVGRINADLANDLGNLVSRTVTMAHKYFGGTLPSLRLTESVDFDLIGPATALKDTYVSLMEAFNPQAALVEIFKVISRSNKYIDETTPWILGKDKNAKPRLSTVLYNLLESIRICAILLGPVMPTTADAILDQLGAVPASRTLDSAGTFGLLPLDVSVRQADNLFPRIDLKEELAYLANVQQQQAAPAADTKSTDASADEAETGPVEITIDDFMRTQLVVAQVLSCEKVEKSDKLLLLKLDDGSGTSRQVVSGIAGYYKPEDLTGRKVIVVANLKPAKLRGNLSQGMILAADSGDDVVVMFAPDDAQNGSRVR